MHWKYDNKKQNWYWTISKLEGKKFSKSSGKNDKIKTKSKPKGAKPVMNNPEFKTCQRWLLQKKWQWCQGQW